MDNVNKKELILMVSIMIKTYNNISLVIPNVRLVLLNILVLLVNLLTLKMEICVLKNVLMVNILNKLIMGYSVKIVMKIVLFVMVDPNFNVNNVNKISSGTITVV